MSLLVLDAGLESRVVDLGRPRSRSLGVPVGGAADRRALILGNALLGNPPDSAGLEATLKGPRLRAIVDLGCVVFGAPFATQCDGVPLEVGVTFNLRAGQELQIGGAPVGARAYLCVRGGFEVASVLASRSSLEPIRKGAVLPCNPSRICGRFCPQANLPTPDRGLLAVLPGLQASWLDEREFYRQSFTVTAASNRMGLRLRGEPLAMPSRELVSEAVCPGAIQVTPDGQCIILGMDGQTIGGYPKIAHVVQAHLDRLGQMRPGEAIQFRKVSQREAIDLDRHAHAEMHQLAMRMRLSLGAFPGES